MDCRDRLAFWLLELLLEPVRALNDDEGVDSVTVRADRGARRFNLTIARGGDGYRWAFREVSGPGSREPTPVLVDEATESLSDPEYAFWAGWGAIEQHAG